MAPAAPFGSGGEEVAVDPSRRWCGRLARMDPGQLSLLDLNLRQGLDRAKIAAVLGTSTANALIVLARLEHVAEEFLAAFVMSRLPRNDCPRLTAALATVDTAVHHPNFAAWFTAISPSVLAARRAGASCVAPRVFAALSAAEPPAGTRERILDGSCGDGRYGATRPQRASGTGRGHAPLSLPVGSARPAGRGACPGGACTVVALLAGALFAPPVPSRLVVPGGMTSRRLPRTGGAASVRDPHTDANRTAATATVPRTASPSVATVVAGSATPAAATGLRPLTGPPLPRRHRQPRQAHRCRDRHPPPRRPTPTAVPCVPRLATNGISQLFLAPVGPGRSSSTTRGSVARSRSQPPLHRGWLWRPPPARLAPEGWLRSPSPRPGADSWRVRTGAM